MIFASDNWAGAHPAIAERLTAAASGYYAPYGDSEFDKKITAKISDIFERDCAVFFVATGTAANSLSLASAYKTAGVIFCHTRAHVIHHEGGAVELQTNGAKLVPVNGPLPGKIDPAALEMAMHHFPSDDVHVGQKIALTLSQATEAGTIYTIDEIRALTSLARANSMVTHMDGARFTNALVSLGITPAEMTWKSGIDILSLGATKNGCWAAEAVVVFDPALAARLPHLRKRAGHLFSKSTFVAAQFDAWLENGLWTDLAAHSNRMAGKLATAVRASNTVRLAWETGGNQLFLIMPQDKAADLRAAGAQFYDWSLPEGSPDTCGPNEIACRFITSFATREADIDALVRLL